MLVEDTPEAIEFILGEEDLTGIQEEYTIPLSIRLKLQGHSKRMTMGSMTHMALHEDVFKARLRLLLSAIIAKAA